MSTVSQDAAELKSIAAALQAEGHAALNTVSTVVESKMFQARAILGNSPAGAEFTSAAVRIGTNMNSVENLINAVSEMLEGVADHMLKGRPR